MPSFTSPPKESPLKYYLPLTPPLEWLVLKALCSVHGVSTIIDQLGLDWLFFDISVIKDFELTEKGAEPTHQRVAQFIKQCPHLLSSPTSGDWFELMVNFTTLTKHIGDHKLQWDFATLAELEEGDLLNVLQLVPHTEFTINITDEAEKLIKLHTFKDLLRQHAQSATQKELPLTASIKDYLGPAFIELCDILLQKHPEHAPAQAAAKMKASEEEAQAQAAAEMKASEEEAQARALERLPVAQFNHWNTIDLGQSLKDLIADMPTPARCNFVPLTDNEPEARATTHPTLTEMTATAAAESGLSTGFQGYGFFQGTVHPDATAALNLLTPAPHPDAAAAATDSVPSAAKVNTVDGRRWDGMTLDQVRTTIRGNRRKVAESERVQLAAKQKEQLDAVRREAATRKATAMTAQSVADAQPAAETQPAGIKSVTVIHSSAEAGNDPDAAAQAAATTAAAEKLIHPTGSSPTARGLSQNTRAQPDEGEELSDESKELSFDIDSDDGLDIAPLGVLRN